MAQQLAPWQVLERLARSAESATCRAAVALAEARRRATEKFGDLAPRLFLDEAGLEMASAAAVAGHRAARFPAGAAVADLTCGVGGDTLALAQRGPVVAVDRDATRALMAHLNAEVAGAADRVAVCRGDATAPPVRCDAAFVDPARRSPGGRRVRRAEDYDPPLASTSAWRRWATHLAVKVSPALDEAQWPAGTDEAEFVSWRSQCREAVLWFGPTATARRRATVVGHGSLAWDADEPPAAEVGEPGPFLFEPDPAVVRSHLVGLLAQQLDACLLSPQVAYLSASRGASTPFARCFAVLARVPFSRDRLRRVLAAQAWRPTEILRRHFPIAPDALRRDLAGAAGDGATPVCLVCTRVDGRPVVFICEPVGQ